MGPYLGPEHQKCKDPMASVKSVCFSSRQFVSLSSFFSGTSLEEKASHGRKLFIQQKRTELINQQNFHTNLLRETDQLCEEGIKRLAFKFQE